MNDSGDGRTVWGVFFALVASVAIGGALALAVGAGILIGYFAIGSGGKSTTHYVTVGQRPAKITVKVAPGVSANSEEAPTEKAKTEAATAQSNKNTVSPKAGRRKSEVKSTRSKSVETRKTAPVEIGERKTQPTQTGLKTEAKQTEPKTTRPRQTATMGMRIASKPISGLGEVLVNKSGRTLYIFLPDKRSKVACVASCAAVWPPVKLSSGETPVASGTVKSGLLGSAQDPSGGKVVTYNGWPLYTYVADASPGTATGQAVNANGGLWYVIAPSGTVIKKAL